MCVHRHYKDFETIQNQIDTIKFTPEKSKQIALARLDLIHKWLEFRRKANNKLQADYDFVNLHNTSNSHLFQVIGKISRGSLRRWHACFAELAIIKSYFQIPEMPFSLNMAQRYSKVIVPKMEIVRLI